MSKSKMKAKRERAKACGKPLRLKGRSPLMWRDLDVEGSEWQFMGMFSESTITPIKKE